MIYKKEIKILFVLPLVIIGIFAIIAFFGEEFGMCKVYGYSSGSSYCGEMYGEEYFYAILSFAFSILIPIIPLYFTRESTYKSWRKFAIIALPLLILWISSSPVNGSSGFIGIGLENREGVMIFGTSLFVIISYILIIVKTIKVRKK